MADHVDVFNAILFLQCFDNIVCPNPMFGEIELTIILVVNFDNRINGIFMHRSVKGYLTVFINVGPKNGLGYPSFLGSINHVFFSMVATTSTVEKEGGG